MEVLFIVLAIALIIGIYMLRKDMQMQNKCKSITNTYWRTCYKNQCESAFDTLRLWRKENPCTSLESDKEGLEALDRAVYAYYNFVKVTFRNECYALIKASERRVFLTKELNDAQKKEEDILYLPLSEEPSSLVALK